ncbi:MAG: GNAT family N-acetyltransferase [Actinomycetota bacterium]|nr:GNAT family N-acetyltransferase [Actinomycetota bacterium]
MEIREAHDHEYDAAGHIAVEGYRDFYRDRFGDYEGRLRDIAARAAAAHVLVAIDNGEVVGTVTYVSDPRSDFAQHAEPHEASIRMLSVAPAHKRRGIGKALSVACIERARAEGKRRIVLHADEIMQASRALYESLGFRRDPARDFEPDDETMLLCYVLELRGVDTLSM